jgi:hypothetical protein
VSEHSRLVNPSSKNVRSLQIPWITEYTNPSTILLWSDGIGEIAPQFVLNVDETGFGACIKSGNVIALRRFGAMPVFNERVDSHFVMF